MKFVTSTDLDQWANHTKEGSPLLPELILKLIQSSTNSFERLYFPVGDATYLPGWDGILQTCDRVDLVPPGTSLWEMGVDKGINAKINSDFNKRLNDPLGYNRDDSTFVFVTPRRWVGADKWLRKHTGQWGKIVIYTAVELETWIEQHPSVGLWFAEKIGVLSSKYGVVTPDTYWEKWSKGNKYSLPYEIVLSGRINEENAIAQVCSHPSSLVLSSTTQEECIAFAVASIFNNEKLKNVWSRVIVANDEMAYNDLVDNYKSLIIITNVKHNIQYAIERDHSVIVATTPEDQVPGACKLPILERSGFVSALERCGKTISAANKLAKITSNDVNVLRRLEGFNIEKPQWSNPKDLSILLPALLVGKWECEVPGDREIIERLSGKEYETYELQLKGYLLQSNTPFIQIGNQWRVRSTEEAIVHSKTCITHALLDKLSQLCCDLVSDDDNKFSDNIKKGVYGSLIFISKYVDSGWTEQTLRKMMSGWSIKRLFRNRFFLSAFAEISPDVFLEFIDGLSDDILYKMFASGEKDSIYGYGESFYPELLWALEKLAWEEEYFLRVVQLLVRFYEYNISYKLTNCPLDSLLPLFRFYVPQTFVSTSSRIEVLKKLGNTNERTTYQLCYKILHSLDDKTLFFSSSPRFCLTDRVEDRSFSWDDVNTVNSIMLECCSFTEKELAELVDLSFNSHMVFCRKSILHTIRLNAPKPDYSGIIVQELRNHITHHRQYPDATWSLSDSILVEYESLLRDIESPDLIEKNLWLFNDHYAQLPQPMKKNHQDVYDDMVNTRIMTLISIRDNLKMTGIWKLVTAAKCPESIAFPLSKIFGFDLIDEVCAKYQEGIINESFFKSYCRSLFTENKTKYLAMINQLNIDDKQLVQCLCAPGYCEDLHHLARQKGEHIYKMYWSCVDVNEHSSLNCRQQLDGLLQAKRFTSAICLSWIQKDTLLLTDIEKLRILRSYFSKENIEPENMFSLIDAVNVLEELDKSALPEVEKDLARLEFSLYDAHQYRIDWPKTKLIRKITHEPESLFNLVMLAYKPDDSIEKVTENSPNSPEFKTYLTAKSILFSDDLVPCLNNDGKIDEEELYNFIFSLQKLAAENNRTKYIDYIIGDLLGNIPRNEDYPQVRLCEIVEELKSDKVDSRIQTKIYNSRGVVCKSFKEGGGQEKSLVETFNSFREKTKVFYPRMTKIFDYFIREYSRQATHEDESAELENLEY